MWQAAIPIATNLLAAGWQFHQFNKLSKRDFPEYRTPENIFSMQRLAQERAGRGIFPGQDTATMELERTTANALDNMTMGAGSSSELLGASQMAGMTESAGKRQLSMTAAQYRDSAERDLMRVEEIVAGYMDKEYNINRFTPYMQQAQVASQMLGSAMGNISNAANMFANFAFQDQYLSMIEKNGSSKDNVVIPGQDQTIEFGTSPKKKNIITSFPEDITTKPEFIPDPTQGAIYSNWFYND